MAARWWLALGGMVLAIALFGKILIGLALACLLATGFAPVVGFLVARGLPRGRAVALVMLGLVGVGVAVAFLVVPPIARQVAGLGDALPAAAARLQALGARWEALDARLAFLPSLPEVTRWLTETAAGYMRGALAWTGHFVGLAGSLAVLGLMFALLLADGPVLLAQVLLLVPPFRRPGAHDLLASLGTRLGRYCLGTLVDMAVVGGLTVLGLWLVGVPDALALGTLIGLCNLVPMVGAMVGAIPAFLVAFGVSTALGWKAVAVVLLVQQLESNMIYPRLVGQAVGLHPLYVLLALAAGMQVAGIPTVFLGVPAAIAIKTVLEALVLPRIEQRGRPAVTITALVGVAGEPAQGAQAGHEGVLPAAGRHEGG